MHKLDINRPEDAVEAISSNIIKEIENKYSEKTPEYLVVSLKDVTSELVIVQEAISSHSTKYKKVQKKRKEWTALLDSYKKDVLALSRKYDIDIEGFQLLHGAQLTGRTFNTQFSNIHVESVMFSGAKVPRHIDMSKLDDLLIKEYEIKMSISILKRMLKEKAALYQEMLELSA